MSTLRRIKRLAEMSAELMRDPVRTGRWEGAENVARQFDEIAKLATEPEPEYYAIMGKYTGAQIGVCTAGGKEDALRQSDTGKLVPITKEEFDAYQ